MKYIEKRVVFAPAEVRRAPGTRDHPIVGSAPRLMTAMDLGEYGYMEEEYIVGDYANVYSWPKEQPRPIIISGGMYRTRILVRKPVDPKKFSGNVCMESFNGSFTIDHCNAGWGLCHEYMMESGDAWVGYTKDGNCVEELKTIDPDRYGALGYPNPRTPEECGETGWDPFLAYCAANNMLESFPIKLDPAYERGLTYDAMYQIAALIKRCAPGDPFAGYEVATLIAFGINDYNTHIAGLHPYLRGTGDRPLVDGYLMYMSGEGGQLNYAEPCFPLDDERCLRTCDVPAIKIQTAGDLGGHLPHPLWAALWRCEDGDAPGGQMRWYEIPGLGVHAAFRSDKFFFSGEEDYARAGAQPRKSSWDYWNQMSRHIMVGALHNMKAWIREKKLPPRAEKILVDCAYPNLSFHTDGHGNHIGGIRHPYVEVPIGVFDDNSQIEFFDRAKRDSLYADQREYVGKVRACATQMVRDGWILPYAVSELVKQAEELGWR